MCSASDGGTNDGVTIDTRTSNYAQIVTSDSPVGYWRLGDAVGSVTAANEVDPTAVGTRENSVNFGMAGAIAFDTNTAAAFDQAEDDCLPVGSLPTFDFIAGETFSIEAWVKLKVSNLPEARIIASKINGTIGYELIVETTGILSLRTGNSGGTTSVQTATPLPTGEWVHLVGASPIVNGVQRGVLYVNGGLVKDETLGAHPPAANNASFAIGCRAVAEHFDGELDEVAIYDRALTLAEVALHYTTGVGQ